MATNKVGIHGIPHAVARNFERSIIKVAEFTFEWDEYDANGVQNKTIAEHPTGVVIPKYAVVMGGFVEVNTAFTSAETNTAQISIQVQGANDIITAAAVSGAPWSTVGFKAIVPKINTPESTSIKLTADRDITVKVATTSALLTAGKFTGYLFYVDGVATA